MQSQNNDSLKLEGGRDANRRRRGDLIMAKGYRERLESSFSQITGRPVRVLPPGKPTRRKTFREMIDAWAKHEREYFRKHPGPPNLRKMQEDWAKYEREALQKPLTLQLLGTKGEKMPSRKMSIEEMEEALRRRGIDPRAAFERDWERTGGAVRQVGGLPMPRKRTGVERRYRLPAGVFQEQGAFEVPGLAYRRERGRASLRVTGRPAPLEGGTYTQVGYPTSEEEALTAAERWKRSWGPLSPTGKRRAALIRIQAEKNRRWAERVTARDRQIRRSLLGPLQRRMVQIGEHEALGHQRELEKIGARRPRPKWGEGGPGDYEEKLEIESRYREPKPLSEGQRRRATANYTIAQDIINKYPNREDETAAIREAIERSPEITREDGSPKAVRDMLSGYYGSIEAPAKPEKLTEGERGRADVNFAFANRIIKKFPSKEQRAEAIQEALTKAPLITQQDGNPTTVLNMVKGYYSGSFVEDLITGLEGIMAEQEKRRQGLK